MFAIPWNFPFRKKDGSMSTLDSEISAGGGGETYTLPTASAETKGGIKIGAGLSMDGETLNNSNPTAYTLPTAGAETKGGIKIGAGLSMDGEVLNNSNPTAYTLPTASAETLGGVKVGSGLTIEGGVLSASGGSTETWDTIWNNSNLLNDVSGYSALTPTAGVTYDAIVISYFGQKQNQTKPFYQHIEINNHIAFSQEVSTYLLAVNPQGSSGNTLYARPVTIDIVDKSVYFNSCLKINDFTADNSFLIPRWIRARRKPAT